MLRELARILRLAREVRMRTGKGRLEQFLEVLRLRLSACALGATEYYDLCLFDDDLYSATAKRSFIGRRFSTCLDQRLNENGSRILANDKIVNYALLARLGFPIPRTYATFNKKGRFIGDEERLTTLDQVRGFLRSEARYPLFVKPVCGTYGRGALGISEYLAGSDQVRLLDGSLTSTDTLLADFQFGPYDGKLFQEVLTSHSEIAAITGPRISCVRMIVVVVDMTPRLHTAFWKIAVGTNMTDNSSLGKKGNLLAAIDLRSGQVGHVIGGLGPSSEPVTSHPTTGRTLRGFALPHWNRVTSLCLEVAPHFPGLRLQNWDVAICQDGPVLMELNTEADLGVPQAVTRVGMLDDLMFEVLRQSAKGR